MNKSIFLPVTILSAFLLFASCNDNGKTSSNNHTQDDKEYSVSDSDSVKQKTIKDTTLSFEKNNAYWKSHSTLTPLGKQDCSLWP